MVMSIGRPSRTGRRIPGESGRERSEFDAREVSYFRDTGETSGERLGIFDEKGNFSYASRGLCELLGYSREELVSRPVADYIDAGSKILLEKQLEVIKAGATELFKIVWMRRDGTSVNTFVTSRRVSKKEGLFKMTLGTVGQTAANSQSSNGLTGSVPLTSPLLGEILEAQEVERKRISRDLHDEVGQALTVIKLNVGLMTRSIPEQLNQIRQDCAELISCIDHVIEHVRKLARELSPALLEDVGLGAALRALLHEFARGTGLKVRADIVGLDRVLPRQAEIAVYRIIQELLKNVMRHAKASNLLVIGGIEGRQLAFLVEDDGLGFDSNRTLKEAGSRGLGLALISERVRLLGGSFDLRSEVGKGTRIRFAIPIDEVEK